MRHELPLTLALFITLLSACGTQPPVEEKLGASGAGKEPEAKPLTTLDQTCIEPSYLVRDLTVPWAQRNYLVGPCDGTSSQDIGSRTHHDTTPTNESVMALEEDK